MCKSPRTMWQLLCPPRLPLNFIFLLFLVSISSSLTTNLLILYDHFLRISKIHPLFSSHFTKIFIQALILVYLFINCAFTFLPFFVIIAIVFMGHQEGMEVKLQNLDYIPYVSEMAQNVLGSFFSLIQYLY